MAVFKCKVCGGANEITADQSVLECEYCGRQQTIPRLDDERIADLYDRANHFRRNNDYDKALGIYELILNENKEDAEAHWSIVLCRYGIEYVEDPKTMDRVPTINRAQFMSILADDDYKSALMYADTLQRTIYEREAKEIEEIRARILRMVQKEEPYDVFICYKDKDAVGDATYDRVIATEIYNRLTREKFKVFFAYVTLDEKLGHEYEPYIFAALQSAKVMIVLGTKPEYFNAVWVKNEWSRYLTLIKGGAKKTLISVYKNMDPYDLPDELSLQAQDMDKMGFLENLVYNVRREVERNTEKKKDADSSGIVIKGTNENANNFIKRAFMALEDRNWRDATMFCEKVLNLDPECGIAYAGKLLAELQLQNFELLGGYAVPFDSRANYIRAVQFADGELKDILETASYQVAYRIASEKMSAKKYQDALVAFEKISYYKDSAKKAAECKRILAEIERERIRKEQECELERKHNSLKCEAEELHARINRGKFAVAYIVVILLIVLAAVAVITELSFVPADEALEVLFALSVFPFLFFAAFVLHKLKDINYFRALGLALFPNFLTWIYILAVSCKTLFVTPRYAAQYSRLQQEISQCRNQMKNDEKGLYAEAKKQKLSTGKFRIRNTILLIFALIVGVICADRISEYINHPARQFEYSMVADGIRIDRYIGDDPDVEIPSHIDGVAVVAIGKSAFEYTSRLKSVIIPETVTTIGKYAFSGLDKLTSVHIPNSVTLIEYHAFADCETLEQIEYNGTMDEWKSISKDSAWWMLYRYTHSLLVKCSDGGYTYSME